MNKEKILKKSEMYTTIINNRQSQKNKYFSIYYQKLNSTLFGITVPKKIGKAHIRNKIKRQIKNIITKNEKDIQKEYNYVIIVKEAIKELNYQKMSEELMDLFKKVRN